MQFLKIFLGLIAVVLAWVLAFRSGLIFRLNQWMRDYVFSDQIVLFAGRRVAVLLLILGVIALFSGVEDVVSVRQIKPKIAAEILLQAEKDLANRNFRLVILRSKELVRSNPNYIKAWELLATAWWARGEKEKAKKAADAWIEYHPETEEIPSNLQHILNYKPEKS